jgi:hypothetical protein
MRSSLASLGEEKPDGLGQVEFKFFSPSQCVLLL